MAIGGKAVNSEKRRLRAKQKMKENRIQRNARQRRYRAWR